MKKVNTTIILCAGRSSRISEALSINNTYIDKNIVINDFKPMILYKNKPLLQYTIDFWKPFTNRFIFVVGHKKELIIDYITSTADYEYFFVYQDSLEGIASAIYQTKDIVRDKNFLVVLGDCICSGQLLETDFDDSLSLGVIFTTNTKKIMNGYSVKTKDNRVVEVVEKPKNVNNCLCGLGYYYFSSDVFTYISKTPKSSFRNEVEITDVIQLMIEDGYIFKCFHLNGRYVNINYLEDLQELTKIL